MRDSKGRFTKGLRPEKITGRYKKCDWKDCDKQIWTVPFRQARNRDKYCSRKCRGLAERGVIWSTTGLFRKGIIPHNKGKFGEESTSWIGKNKAGYVGTHQRVKRKLPKPDACQKCLKFTSKLDLSSISWKYTDDITDWEWLCKSCHNKRDWRNGNQVAKIFRMKQNQVPYKRIT